ncbi:3-methyl-2-oxobutanoate hydroxymethyltransferase [Deinococcota bacterium DY0809b]
MLTAYDYPTAKLAAEAGVDVLLVGDSLGMVVLGYDSTVPVTLEEVLHHTKAARRGAPEVHLVTDLPFLADATPERALAAAERLVKEGGADSVKLEGAKLEAVRALVSAGVPVLGHVGLTPQTASSLGGYRVQGKTPAAAKKLLEDALALEAAGVWGVVLEMVPVPLARLVSEQLSVPTIGIGAGAGTDGQVLVFHDLIGVFDRFKPKFVRRYLEGGALIRDAIAAYAADVRSGAFPADEHGYAMDESALEGLYGKES